MNIFGVVIAHQDMPVQVVYFFFKLTRVGNDGLWWVQVPREEKPMYGTFPIIEEDYIINLMDVYPYEDSHFNKTIEIDFRATACQH